MSRSRLLALTGALGFATIAGTAAAPGSRHAPAQPAARAAALTLQISIPGQGPRAHRGRSRRAPGRPPARAPSPSPATRAWRSSASRRRPSTRDPADGHRVGPLDRARRRACRCSTGSSRRRRSRSRPSPRPTTPARRPSSAPWCGASWWPGQPVADGTNRVIVIAGRRRPHRRRAGRRAARRARPAHASRVALHLRLRAAYRGLPGRHGVRRGLRGRGAAVPAAAEPPPRDGRHRARARCDRGAGAAADAGHDPGGARLAARVRARRPTATRPGRSRRRPAGSRRRRRSTRPCRPACCRASTPSRCSAARSFSDDFGAPRARTGFHQGIDLFAPHGTPLARRARRRRLPGRLEQPRRPPAVARRRPGQPLLLRAPLGLQPASRRRTRSSARARSSASWATRATPSTPRRTCTSRSTRRASGPCRRSST